MLSIKVRKLVVAFGIAAASLAVAVPAAQARVVNTARPSAASPAVQATTDFTYGEKLAVLYGNSPLRTCASESCGVIAYMPATTSYGPGGGWVTSLANQNSTSAFCIINWRGDVGWTGCWRLGGITIIP